MVSTIFQNLIGNAFRKSQAAERIFNQKGTDHDFASANSACNQPGSRSAPFGHVSAPSSSVTCVKKSGSASGAYIPGLRLFWIDEQSIIPLRPSQKVTANLNSGSTDTALIRHGATGIIPMAEFSWVVVWLGIGSSPPSVQLGAHWPILSLALWRKHCT